MMIIKGSTSDTIRDSAISYDTAKEFFNAIGQKIKETDKAGIWNPLVILVMLSTIIY